jgi:hypothetical protein
MFGPDNVSNRLETVSTPKQFWVECTNMDCAWEGWDRELHTHEVNAGGESWIERCCPNCGAKLIENRGHREE